VRHAPWRAHRYARARKIVALEEVLPQVEARMRKAIDALKHELASVRTGRAAPSLAEELEVDAYGAATPLVSLAAISAPEPRQIVIQPWDRSLIKAIEKAILGSDLGLTPGNDGAVIRLNIPALNEERRRELVKQLHKKVEEGRVEIRNLEGQLEEARREAQRSRNEADVARQEANDSRDALTVAQREAEDTRRHLDEARHATDEARGATEAARIRYEEAQREADSLREQLREARDNVRGMAGRADQELAEAQERAAHAARELADARAEAARHQAEGAPLRERTRVASR